MKTSTYFAIVHGDMYDGLMVYGPFETHEEATQWANKNYLWYAISDLREPVRESETVVMGGKFEPLSNEEREKYFPKPKEFETRPIEEKSSFSLNFETTPIFQSKLSDQKGTTLVSDLDSIVNELQNKLYNAQDAQRELQEAKYDLDNAEEELSTFVEDLENLISTLEDVPTIDISVSVDVEFDSDRV